MRRRHAGIVAAASFAALAYGCGKPNYVRNPYLEGRQAPPLAGYLVGDDSSHTPVEFSKDKPTVVCISDMWNMKGRKELFELEKVYQEGKRTKKFEVVASICDGADEALRQLKEGNNLGYEIVRDDGCTNRENYGALRADPSGLPIQTVVIVGKDRNVEKQLQSRSGEILSAEDILKELK